MKCAGYSDGIHGAIYVKGLLPWRLYAVCPRCGYRERVYDKQAHVDARREEFDKRIAWIFDEATPRPRSEGDADT